MGLDYFMNDMVTLERLSPTRGGTATQATPLYLVDSDAILIPVSIQPASASTRLSYMKQQMTVSHSLYFDYDWAPNTRDRWVLDLTRYFIVRGWYESLEWNDTWTCDCEEIRVVPPQLPIPGGPH